MGRLFALVVVAAALMTASVAAQPAARSADGKDRRIRLENLGSQPIHGFYASPGTSTTWEEDLLGQRTLPAGQTIVANIGNGTTECSYDLKIVLANGRERQRRAVDVCRVSRWIIGDSGDSLQ